MPTLNWVGKDKVVNHHRDVPFRVLEHKYGFKAEDGESKDPSESGNMIIHGDNLEALKTLLPEYEGEVKCIYIDPPYNTGKAGWTYNDSVNHPKIQQWMGKVVGDEDEDLSRHDKWLCMMYPRLQLLRKLLSDTGLIFISINDIEVSLLRLMCDEIFGKKNFLTHLIWNSEGNTDNQLEIKINHEYILVYCKDIRFKHQAIGRVVDPNTRDDSNLWKGIADNNINKNNPANPPSIVELPIGFPCAEKELTYKAKEVDDDFFDTTKEEGKISDKVKEKYGIENLSGLPVKLDDLVVKNHKLTKPCRIYGGLANKNKLIQFIENNCEPIMDGKSPLSFYLNANSAVRYRKEVDKPRNILSVLKNFGTTEKMRTELKKIGIGFSYPKPVDLIKYLLSFGAEPKDSIILDAFAGSGTTGHSVLRLNKEDGGSRKYVLIQLDEYNKDGDSVNVCETITTKRIRNVHETEIPFSGFDLYELGQPLFLDNNNLNEEVGIAKIRQYIWYSETRSAFKEEDVINYRLGEKDQTTYYFIYEKDRLTTLDFDFLSSIQKKKEQYVIYADNCLLPKEFMTKHNIIFKKIPRDITRF